MDTTLFDFMGLKPNGIADPEGDTAFDASELSTHSTVNSCESSPVGTRPAWAIHVDADHLKNT